MIDRISRAMAICVVLAASPAAAQSAHSGHDQAGHAQAGHDQAGHSGHSGESPSGGSAQADYAAAMERMHGPMMQGIANPDPDVAFVLGMLPHHRGAIDMARIELRYGKDEFARKMAEAVIAAQEGEVAEMEAWLAEKGIPVPGQ